MSGHAPIPYTTEARPDTGVSNATMGFWLFIASEVMLFGALFSSYALLRVAATDWPSGREVLNLTLGTANTFVLIGATLMMLSAAKQKRSVTWMLVAASFVAAMFLAMKGLEYRAEWVQGIRPATSTFWAMYFTLTGLHALHVVGGIAANIWVLLGARSVGEAPVREAMTSSRLRVVARYWVFVDAIWIVMFVGLYLS